MTRNPGPYFISDMTTTLILDERMAGQAVRYRTGSVHSAS